MKFGKEGGLHEILYAGTGFLLVRREAYWKIFDDLQLPLCNEQLDRASIPFYMPMVREYDDAHWYLAEDFAFGERARQCGIKTYADTRIRLWHIGNYRYGWEDAGMERPRFASFTMNFTQPQDEAAPEVTAPTVAARLASFAADFPWPKACPNAPLPELPEIPSLDVSELLSRHLSPATRLILEVGSGAGHLTRLLATHPSGATVIALEDWPYDRRADSEEPPATSVRLENFLSECWELRRRIVPVPGNYAFRLQMVADAKLLPNVIVVNDQHQRQLTRGVLSSLLKSFPGATLIGNGFDEIRWGEALRELAVAHGRKFHPFDHAWLMQIG